MHLTLLKSTIWTLTLISQNLHIEGQVYFLVFLANLPWVVVKVVKVAYIVLTVVV